MTLIRVVADATCKTDMRLLGRQFSAVADLFAILFLYLLVSHLYGRRVGLLAALFSALTVMQIQQSHFFTVDLFANAFAMLTLWFAVAILEYREKRVESREEGIGDDEQGTMNKEEGAGDKEQLEVEAVSSEVPTDNSQPVDVQPVPTNSPFSSLFTSNWSLFRNPLFLLSIGFRFALGMAMASKINIAPLAIVLPAAFVLRYFVQKKESDHLFTDHWKLNMSPRPPAARDLRHGDADYWTLVLICLIAGGLATIIAFRIFQPYAFNGIWLDTRWVEDIKRSARRQLAKPISPGTCSGHAAHICIRLRT
jgi:type III secretory pathway component EscS